MVVDVVRACRPKIEVRRSGDSSRRAAQGLWVVFALVLVGALVYLIWSGQRLTFFYDEWGWIEHRNSGLHSVLASYNDHLMVLPLAVFQMLFHTVGLGDYSVYRVVGVVAHLLCAAVVFGFARRRVGAAALLLAIPITFLGTGWENELWPLNFGLPVSLALGIGAVLALERRDRRGDALTCGLLVLGLLFAELAALFAVGIAVAQMLRDRSLRRAWVWAVPLVLYGAWWIAYYEPLSTSHHLGKVPKFAADMAASAAGSVFDAGLQRGRVILVALIALVGWRAVRRHTLTPSLVALLTVLLGFWLLVAISRTELGLPWASHYVYIGAVLIVVIVAESLRGASFTLVTLAIAPAIAALALIGNLYGFNRGVNYLRAASRAVRSELGALQLVRSSAPPTLVLDPYYAPQIQTGPYFAAVRALGSPPTDSPEQLMREGEPERAAADDLLRRTGELQLSSSSGSTSPLVDRPSPVVEAAPSSSVIRQHRCVEFRSRGPAAKLDVLLAAGGLDVEFGSGPPGKLRARRFASRFQRAPVATLPAGRSAIIRAKPDSSTVPWHVQLGPARSVRACTLQ